MRIAVSGTHCSGKSTLVEDFSSAHRDYIHEPEPFEWLGGLYGEGAAEEPTIEDFYRQLELSVDRLQGYARGARVIVERSPVDFLAYMVALTDLGRAPRDCAIVASAAELVAAGVSHIDLLVLLPLNDNDGIVCPEAEDLELREAMNDRLLELVGGDEYSLFTSGVPRVVEIRGARDRRIQRLEEVVFGRT